MNFNRPFRSGIFKNVLPGIVTTLLVLILTWGIDSQERERYQNEVRLSASSFGVILHDILSNEVNAHVLVVKQLKTMWNIHGKGVKIDDFRQYARVIREHDPEAIRSVQLAPNGVISYVYPLQGNEGVVGLDILKHHKLGQVAQQTLLSQDLTVAGPMDLIQGGKGLVARLPLFIDQEDPSSFWGFGTVVINLEPVLAKVSSYLSGSGYHVALRALAADGAPKAVFFGDEQVFQAHPHVTTVHLAKAQWQIGVLPIDGWPTAAPSSLWLWLTGSTLALVCGILVSSLMISNHRLRVSRVKAEAANVTKSEFLSHMSHELRSPLNAIMGFSDSIRHQVNGPLNNPVYEEYIEHIHASGTHLLDVINDILDLSAVEAGALIVSEDKINVEALFVSTINMLRPRAESGRLKLSYTLADPFPFLQADERRAKQIVINLLTNAIKYTPQGGEIVLDATLSDDGSMIISITDNGIGMSQQDVRWALTMFGQVRNTSNTAHEGTGLGLPLCEALMKEHDGSLHIESALGKGTTVSITFPPHRVVEIS